MFKKTLLISLCAAAAFSNSACQSAEKTNANTAVVVNSANAQSQANLPPEFSGKPMSVDSNAPGIPADAKSFNANLPKGVTPTPGIPDPKTLGKPLPRGATPTPGIPSQEELRKQMNTPLGNPNSVNEKPPAAAAAAPNANGVRSPIDRPRTARTP